MKKQINGKYWNIHVTYVHMKRYTWLQIFKDIIKTNIQTKKNINVTIAVRVTKQKIANTDTMLENII